jgi:Cu(I)/Ag(I) efflux system protein CusF
MKFPLLLLSLLAAGPAAAQSMQNMPATNDTPGASAPSNTAEAVGQIKAVDAKAGTLTIHHGPITALGWPAMTMTFKASPDALQAAKAGQTVKFTLKTPENEVVAIQPQ